MEPLFASRKSPPWYAVLAFIMVGLWAYFILQGLIGAQAPPDCGINDALQRWTAPLNAFLRAHSWLGNTILIFCSLLGDAFVLFLLLHAIVRKTLRPVLSMVYFLLLRQILQLIVTLPVPLNMIWHDPGFPSLFVSYQIGADFYFSAFTGVIVLGMLEVTDLKKRWLTIAGWTACFFAALMMIVLRAHYTMDIYTAIVTAFTVFFLAKHSAPAVDKLLPKRDTQLFIVLVILLGIGFFFISQYFISKKTVAICAVGDGLHVMTGSINAFLQTHLGFQDAILVLSSWVLDSLALFLLAAALMERGIRPALALLFFMMLRQCMQLLVALPLPEGLLWHDPGFPSWLSTYDVSNDFYFSAHTGVSLLAAMEVARFKKVWLTVLGYFLFLFEVSTVLVLRAHYVMDVYTALCTVYCVSALAARWAPPIDHFLYKLDKKWRS